MPNLYRNDPIHKASLHSDFETFDDPIRRVDSGIRAASDDSATGWAGSEALTSEEEELLAEKGHLLFRTPNDAEIGVDDADLEEDEDEEDDELDIDAEDEDVETNDDRVFTKDSVKRLH
jgi:hypothetical protein